MNKLRNCTVMVTGASGLVGSRVIKCISQKNNSENTNIRIVACVRNLEKAKKKLDGCSDSIEYYVSDICDEIDYSGNVDYIIHAAGVTGGSKQHIDTPMNTINTAINGTINVLEYARKCHAKGVVYLSSLEIYGKMPVENQVIYEEQAGYIDVTNVRSSYSESKRMCECICSSYAKQYSVPVCIARLTATFGPGVAYNDGRVFAQFARAVIEKQDIVLKSTGETVRNYCDVDDCAKALIMLLTEGKSEEAYNIANPETEISIRDMAERFIMLFPESGIQVKFDLSEDCTKLGYNQTIKSVLAADKLTGIGWKPDYSLDETIKRLVDYMKNNR